MPTALDIRQAFRSALSMVGIEIRPSADTEGPTITSGTGAPTAAEPDGSSYLRTNGAAASTQYLRVSGAWVAASALNSTSLPEFAGITTDDGLILPSLVWSAPDNIPFFVATRACRVKRITARVLVAGTDAGAVTVVLRKVPTGTAIGAGVLLHSGTLNLKGAVDANQVLTLSVTAADLELVAGDALAIQPTGVTTAARGVVTVSLAPR